MKPVIRKATPADADVLAEVRNEALALKLSHGDMAWEETPFTRQEMLDAISRGNIYLALVNNQPAGSVVLHWDNEHTWDKQGLDNKAGYISNLATSDAFRGQQLGVQIVSWACNKIKQAGKKIARLDCPAANAKLCTYYERQGFTRVGTSPAGAALFERKI